MGTIISNLLLFRVLRKLFKMYITDKFGFTKPAITDGSDSTTPDDQKKTEPPAPTPSPRANPLAASSHAADLSRSAHRASVLSHSARMPTSSSGGASTTIPLTSSRRTSLTSPQTSPTTDSADLSTTSSSTAPSPTATGGMLSPRQVHPTQQSAQPLPSRTVSQAVMTMSWRSLFALIGTLAGVRLLVKFLLGSSRPKQVGKFSVCCVIRSCLSFLFICRVPNSSPCESTFARAMSRGSLRLCQTGA